MSIQFKFYHILILTLRISRNFTVVTRVSRITLRPPFTFLLSLRVGIDCRFPGKGVWIARFSGAKCRKLVPKTQFLKTLSFSKEMMTKIWQKGKVKWLNAIFWFSRKTLSSYCNKKQKCGHIREFSAPKPPNLFLLLKYKVFLHFSGLGGRSVRFIMG